MGIINPRPAMRRREERNIRQALAKHASLTTLIAESGCDKDLASKIASDIISTSAKRTKVWRARPQ